MKLVADSGSTKCDWVLLHNGRELDRFHTVGFNPLLCDEGDVIDALSCIERVMEVRHSIEAVHFYGAGCSGSEQRVWMKRVLSRFFDAAVVEVESDTMASVLATCGDAPGIVCILGTGSNSCQFDGHRILPNNFGLGYVLADEGGGTQLGKKAVTAFLYGTMPEELRLDFASRYALTKESVIKHVYTVPAANTWLAGFAGFLADHQHHTWVKEVVRAAFEEFVIKYICAYSGYSELPVHFVGSIAFFWQSELLEVTALYSIKVGKIMRSPIDGLADYHIRQQLSQGEK